MKYYQFRIALLTFTLGLVSVPFAGGLYDKWSEPYVEMPQVKSDTPMFVDIYPTKRFPMQYGGGSGSGCSCNYDSCICAVEKSVGRYINAMPTKTSLKTCCRKTKKR